MTDNFDELPPEQQDRVRAMVREKIQPIARDFVAKHGALSDEDFIDVLGAWAQDMADKSVEKFGEFDPLDVVFGQEIVRACLSRRRAILEAPAAGAA